MFHVKFDKENKIWDGCTDIHPVYNPNISLGNILLKSLALNGTRVAQISDDTGDRFTFEELHKMTIRAAQNLQRLGYYESKQQVVAIMAGNVSSLSAIVFASFCLGCPILPLSGKMEKQTIDHMFQLTTPHLVFCEIKSYDLIVEVLNELKMNVKVFTFNGSKGDSIPVEVLFGEAETEDVLKYVPTEVDGMNETAVIMCTSGVCVSHAALISEIDTTSCLYGNGIAFGESTLYWNTGLLTLLLGTISGTTRIITTENFSVEMQLRIIEKYKVTIVEDSAYDMVLMLKSGLLPTTDLSSVKHYFAGGCKVPLSVVQEFNSYMPNGSVNVGYGLSEVGYNVSVDFPQFSGKDSVGRLVSGYTIKIVDDQGNRCAAGVNGEICIKSRHKFLGYYKKPELTQSAMDSEGFFLTGDLGHIDPSGYLRIVDRKKHMILFADDWVSPTEIEVVLLKSMDIESVCVVGVPYDEVLELPAAVVVRKNGSQITEEDISKLVEDQLIDNCKLRGGVYFTDCIPTTISGKPLRRVVKQMATECYNQLKMKNEQPKFCLDTYLTEH